MATDYAVAERSRQSRWRETSPSLPPEARVAGTFRGRAHPWLLHVDHAAHNLLPSIRGDLVAIFARDGIAWHDGHGAEYGPRQQPGPSPNLMDSQVACLNFWCGLAAASPDALLEVVRAFAPEASRLVAPVAGGSLLEPEWIGLANHLGERGARRPGQYATSADLLVAWEDGAGARHGALIESKYSESYVARDGRFSAQGTDRAEIYAAAVAMPWSPFTERVVATDLLYEPFDQHIRQQQLAAAMEAARELGLHTVRLVHVAPRANRSFHEGITAPSLRGFATVAEAWRSVLRRPDRYASLAYEDLFARAASATGTADWTTSLSARYGWAS
jgi:hypothetical protein